MQEASPRDDVFGAIKVLVLDCDGVLTDGRVFVLPDGQESLAFHRRDGDGIRQLIWAGLRVGIVTREHPIPPALMARSRKLNVKVFSASQDKLPIVKWFVNGDPAGLCYMGDDVSDVAAMEWAAVSVAPADGHPEALRVATWITRASGGHGAVRQVCDRILEARA